MKDMITPLTFSDVMRYLLSGSVFLAAFISSKESVHRLLAGFGQLPGDATGFIAAAFVLGSIFYSFHRLLYRFITRPIQATLISKHKFKLKDDDLFIKREFERDRLRWLRKNNCEVFQANLDRWASHVHFLYCSAWAAFAGAVLGRLSLLNGFDPCRFFCELHARHSFLFFIGFGIVSLIVAVFQDYVLTYYDLRYATEPTLTPDVKPPPPK